MRETKRRGAGLMVALAAGGLVVGAGGVYLAERQSFAERRESCLTAVLSLGDASLQLGRAQFGELYTADPFERTPEFARHASETIPKPLRDVELRCVVAELVGADQQDIAAIHALTDRLTRPSVGHLPASLATLDEDVASLQASVLALRDHVLGLTTWGSIF